MGNGQTNGFHNGNATSIGANGIATNTNGKFTAQHLYERAKQYCSKSIDSIDHSFSSSKLDRFHNDDSESDALLSGDERCFDVEFTDDDLVALEPRDPHLNT